MGYFQPIVLKALPFLGDAASKTAVGIIGFWIGGAFGFNFGKQSARIFCLKAFGHTNSAYIVDEKVARKIIDSNPQYFPFTPAASVDIESQDDGVSTMLNSHIGFVKKGLIYLREQIDYYSGKKKTEHDIYKDAAAQPVGIAIQPPPPHLSRGSGAGMLIYFFLPTPLRG